MRNKILNFILVLLLIAGIGLISYPTVSDLWNRAHQSYSVAVYEDYVQEIDTETLEAEMEKARAYNEALANASDQAAYYDLHQSEYESALNINGSGVMGFVEIPSISATLTIYHGTSDSVLQIAAGHLEWTSLPVGGEGTHSVISGHTGLPSAKLFTDLDQLQEQDTFSIHVLNETLYYEVDQIEVVLPEEAGGLMAEAGKDYCTLITCTPYGINSHRLLVRGHRIYPSFDTAEINSDLNSISPIVAAAVVIAFMLVIEVIIHYLIKRAKRKKAGKERI